jgi:hypothetical protein
VHRPLLVLAATIPVALAVSCTRTREPDRSNAPALAPSSTSPAAPAAPKGAQQPAEVIYVAPPAWSKVENASRMRKATFRIPRAPGDSEDGELSVSQAGGSIDQNLQRWAGQFGHTLADVKRDHRSPSGLQVTLVQIRGAYAGMAMPGAPAQETKPGYALLGAIVETSPPTFFKLTGPERTVTAAQADFDKLVASLRTP